MTSFVNHLTTYICGVTFSSAFDPSTHSKMLMHWPLFYLEVGLLAPEILSERQWWRLLQEVELCSYDFSYLQCCLPTTWEYQWTFGEQYIIGFLTLRFVLAVNPCRNNLQFYCIILALHRIKDHDFSSGSRPPCKRPNLEDCMSWLFSWRLIEIKHIPCYEDL